MTSLSTGSTPKLKQAKLFCSTSPVVPKLWWSVAPFERLSNTRGPLLRILPQKWRPKNKAITLKLPMIFLVLSKSQVKTKTKASARGPLSGTRGFFEKS